MSAEQQDLEQGVEGSPGAVVAEAPPAPSTSARDPGEEKKRGQRHKKEKPPEPEAVLAKTQAFTMERHHRAELKNAPYNPREMDDNEKRKLRAGLKEQGLVAPITWNRRTGNIVGGHQRVSQMDALEGTKNYLLDVAVIDVDEAREKEINILLNNSMAMGHFNLDALTAILQDTSVRLIGTGFDETDMHRLFGDAIIASRDDPLDELAAKIREHRDRYNAATSAKREAMSEEYYVVIVFKDAAACTDFLTKHDLPDNRYQSALDIEALIQGREPNHARSFEEAPAQ